MCLSDFIFVILCFLLFHNTHSKTIIKTVAGVPKFGGDGGFATKANLYAPTSIFLSPNNEFFIADSGNQAIRKIARNGIITTVAGMPGESGGSGNGGLAINAKLSAPGSVYVNSKNEMYIGDYVRVRKVLPNGIIQAFAGYGSSDQDGIPALQSSVKPNCLFGTPWNDELYICDKNSIRKIFPNGTITTVVGRNGQPGSEGDGGLASNATLTNPYGIVVTTKNEMYISDGGAHVIRKVFANGTITTIAGKPNQYGSSGDNGLAINALLYNPQGIAVTQDNDIVFADSFNHAVRKILQKNHTIVTIAGNLGSTTSGYTGDYGNATKAKLHNPIGVFVLMDNEILVADTGNNVIRKIGNDGIIVPFAGYNPKSDKIDPKLKSTNLLLPDFLYVTKTKEIYISDTYNYAIKKFYKDGSAEIIAGGGISFGENIPATSAMISPGSITVNEKNGDVFFVDFFTPTSIKVVRNSILSTYIGPTKGVIQTQLYNPEFIVFENITNSLYMVERSGHVVRRVFTNGTIVTVAGKLNTAGFSGDGGPATNATLNNPTSLTIAPNGDLFILDSNYKAVRKVFTNGTIISVPIPVMTPFYLYSLNMNELYLSDASVLRKVYMNGTHELIAGIIDVLGFTGDGGDPLNAKLHSISSFQVMPDNTIYITDSANNVVRKIANLCTQYSITPVLSVLIEKELSMSFSVNRTCSEYTADEDFFNLDYIPELNILYQSTNTPLNTFAMDWNQVSNHTVSITNQYLDTISIELNGCNSANDISVACNTMQNYAIIPTSSQSR